MRIAGRPSLKLYDVVSSKRKKHEEFPFSSQNYRFFFSARYALAAGIQTLGLKAGDTVLLPAYNCGVEIDPFLHSDINTQFYNVKKNLGVDLNDLGSRITFDVKAVLITHFLGYPQEIEDIRKLCTERKVFLIEDCAHALLSMNCRKFLGSYGDISIFSLLKTLPVPNGGILVINNSNLIMPSPDTNSHGMKRPNMIATIFNTFDLVRWKTDEFNQQAIQKIEKMLIAVLYNMLSFVRIFLVIFKKIFRLKGFYLVKPDSFIYIDDLASWGISGLSEKIIYSSKFREIKGIRRKNYEYLLHYFKKYNPDLILFNELPEGISPLFFPLIVGSPIKRDCLYQALKKRGISTHPWWDRFHSAVRWQDFPDAIFLKERILGLPVHQGLSEEHLDMMIEAFVAADREN